MTSWSPSDSSVKPREYLAMNLWWLSEPSALTPTTRAPSPLKASSSPLSEHASFVQPDVLSFG